MPDDYGRHPKPHIFRDRGKYYLEYILNFKFLKYILNFYQFVKNCDIRIGMVVNSMRSISTRRIST